MKIHTKIFLFITFGLCVTVTDPRYVEINRVNPLGFIIGKINGYFEESNGHKY